MPQGKGTYGSQVGRPSKKKYDKGGNVDPFSTRNPEGVPAEQLAEMMENQNMANVGQEGQEGLPTSNAMDRSQASPMGNEVGTGVYKEGGKVVDITDVVKSAEKAMRFEVKAEESGMPYHHKRKKKARRKAKKDAREIIEASRWGKDRPAGGWNKDKK